ncbi:MAG: ADP-ribosylglycohydrolase family protein [Clostridia bacterium]|nr:ADP-ribosylglycohydrolase family protein [Clostridia bacterium]
MEWKDLSFAHSWEVYGENILTDFQQCLEEGKDVEKYRALVEAVNAMPHNSDKREAMADALFDLFLNAPQRPDYPYVEPSDLEGILASRPANRHSYKKPAKGDELYKKIYGAWLGRICGCLLGKPVEGMRTPDLEKLGKADGNWPITRYFGDNMDEITKVFPHNVAYLKHCYKPGYMPPDDDTNYTVMAAKRIIGDHGRDFTPTDVAHVWLSSQPMSAYCTAERVAYMNFVNAITPPKSAIYKNPFREWIGAQIRADYFGYINPGDPETAADMAWRDASISHVKNGIYGEMFIAAAIAAAACVDDPIEVLLAGLDQIPAKCRLAEDVGNVIAWFKAGVFKEEAFKKIHTQWDEYNQHHWCHTNSNAMIVAAALLYGGLDYGKSITMAVETGFDTDCNGATVGSIIGMMKGKDAIGKEWTDAINDTCDTTITGCGMYSLSELTDITMGHIE